VLRKKFDEISDLCFEDTWIYFFLRRTHACVGIVVVLRAIFAAIPVAIRALQETSHRASKKLSWL